MSSPESSTNLVTLDIVNRAPSPYFQVVSYALAGLKVNLYIKLISSRSSISSGAIKSSGLDFVLPNRILTISRMMTVRKCDLEE